MARAFSPHSDIIVPLTSTQVVEYGHNQVPVRRDKELVAAHFKDIDGYELLCPAFAEPEAVPKGFRGGTVGPTSDTKLGKN